MPSEENEPSEFPVDSQSYATAVVLASPAPQSDSQTELRLKTSVNELRALSLAIHTFTLRYDELQNHLDSIQDSINVWAEELGGSNHEPSGHNDVDEIPSSIATESFVSENPNPNLAIGEDLIKQVSDRPELEILCESMSGRGLRKYIASNLDKIPKLRDEIPKALSLASHPAKLLLEAVGKFYLQGSKAYTKDSPMITARQAAILVLELFLLSDCVKEVDRKVKAEAESAAVAWRKRLITEGGIHKACEMDARGLLLLIGSFGIPSVFERNDVIDLILLSGPREISDALKRSCYIFPKIADWIPKMIKCGMVVKAVSIAYTFGLEKKFRPYDILTLLLKESKDSCDRKRREAQAFPQRAKEAAEKHIAALKSIIECLEYHEVDLSKLLPDWQIKEMIVKAEKDIIDYEKKIEVKALQKRKVEETESLRKRQRYTAETSLAPGQLTGLHDARPAVAHVDHHGSYDIGSRYLGTYPGPRAEILTDQYGHIIYPSGQPYGWKVVNAAYDDRLAVAHAIAEKYPGHGKYSLFGSSSSLEGFPGMQTNPSAIPGVTTRTSISDIYQFADSIEGQSHYTSTSQQAGATVVPDQQIQHTSYYYQ